ncbi:MAG: DUF721 domain-containing protein [Candidatus Omnitrophica bacterium]|nr:DUF721 domain-containing protein [Candidatus Omnitrophota bacterium]
MGPLGSTLQFILRELGSGEKSERSRLQMLWPKIAGPQFTPHTRPALQKDGTVCVWVDDSLLACELNLRYQGTLLKRAQGALGEERVKKIIFRVGQTKN